MREKMAQLTAALDDAIAGHGRLVAGKPVIGEERGWQK